MTAFRATFLFLIAILSVLPAKTARADLPDAVTPAAAVTPTAASAAAKPGRLGAPCRPGTPGVLLDSGQAKWTISSCSGALQAVTLSDPQFHVMGRPEPAGLPRWASSKYGQGQIDLVPTWDAPWDPFQDTIVQAMVAGAPTVKIQRKDGAAQTVPSLAALQKSEPEWALLDHDATHVAMIWPDPQKIQAPLYLVKTWKLAGKNAEGAAQPLSLQVDVAVWNVSGQAAQVTLQTQVSSFQDPNAGSGGMLAMFSAPPDNKGAGLWQDGKLVHQDLAGVAKADLPDRQRTGKVDWYGVDSRYFLLAALPLSGYDDKSTTLLLPRGDGGVQAQLTTSATMIPIATCVPSWYQKAWGGVACADDSKAGHTWSYLTFAGPKQTDHLKVVGHELPGSLEFGWFTVIAKPMLLVLRWAHDITGLWPLAILILTLLVKVLLWPVTAKSMQSMKKMQQLKPELDKVRQELEAKAKKLGQDKADPQELNRATFDLYKKHNVNPLGGCLPMLLQMPVYMALYQTISKCVELFNQPLFGWVTDLTAKDPYYVLPLVLGGVMFAQQKLTPQAGGDPAQQKMMLYFMPILFTAMMLQLPSGLTLYILANTVLSVLQTLYVNRSVKAA
jgi:YidC/Oxa1 family membrane protein insertase